MPSTAPRPSATTLAWLATLGARIRTRRKQLGVNATTVAEAAAMSRVTLHRIERGEPSVTVGAWLNALAAVGLKMELADRVARRPKGHGLPRQIPLSEFAQLRRLAWQLEGATTLTPREAFELYERNWRHVDRNALTESERGLVQKLFDAFGGTRRLV